ncbi:MAG: LacI family transcriptional regulator [Lachnospiraceae bacterium]|nr:LacI family transcriptional regulator [Lachnospiraceae bacterium]
MNKAVTISDVATQAGVSVSTASKALCGKGRMADETRTRIIETAVALGYRPNRAAQALSRKPMKVAALVDRGPEEVQSHLVRGLRDSFETYAAFNVDYDIFEFDPISGSAEAKKYLYDRYASLDGLIVQCDDVVTEEVNRMNEFVNIPIVTIVSDSEKIRSVSSVVINAETVGKLAAQFLAMNGAKKTVIIAGRSETYIHERNIAGYREGLETIAGGTSLLGVWYSDDDWKKAYDCTKDAFEKNPDIDGIFVTSYLAPSVCDYLKEKGLEKKVAVIGVDLYDETEKCLRDGSLNATIYQNQYLQAQNAVDVLMDCLSEGYRILPPVRVKPELVMLSNLECYTHRK